MLLLAAALLVTTLSVAGGGSTSPRPEKLDAFLAGLLPSPTQSAQPSGQDSSNGNGYEDSVKWDGFTPLHTDDLGRTYVDVLVQTDGSVKGLEGLGVSVAGRLGSVVAARVPLESLGALTALSNVLSIEGEKQLSPNNDVGVPAIGAPAFRNRTSKNGSGVIVGVVDTGVDFTHTDFRNTDGSTRILFLCDQTDTPQAGDGTCPGKGTSAGGTLWTQAQINAALQGGPAVRQTDTNGHGSHVLGSAAGNDPVYGGVAPGADIIFVKTTFSNTDIVSGVGFINDSATSLGRPLVVNLSLGGHSGPHDGTELDALAFSQTFGPGKPGKVVVAAAGNEGNDNIHADGNVSSGPQTVSFTVPAGTSAVFLSVWYPGSDSLGFSFTDPVGPGPGSFGPGESFPSQPGVVSCRSGTNTCIRVDHSTTQTANNSREVFFLVVPRSGTSSIDVIGTWSFTLTGTSVTAGTFDAWIACQGASCEFPNGNTNKTVGSPAVGTNVIAVGSYVTKECWQSKAGGFCYNASPRPPVGRISSFSSKGPTRDGRQKPEIAAPGQGIASTRSKDASYSD